MGILGKLFGSPQPAPPCAIHDDDRPLVKQQDIEWWNGLSIRDCQSFESQDNASRVAALRQFMEKDGMPEADAAKKVRLSFPFFYWQLQHRSEEVFSLCADDAKLPYVLKDRVNRAAMMGLINKQAMSTFPSVNALVRYLIKQGRI